MKEKPSGFNDSLEKETSKMTLNSLILQIGREQWGIRAGPAGMLEWERGERMHPCWEIVSRSNTETAGHSRRETGLELRERG